MLRYIAVSVFIGIFGAILCVLLAETSSLGEELIIAGCGFGIIYAALDFAARDYDK